MRAQFHEISLPKDQDVLAPLLGLPVPLFHKTERAIESERTRKIS